MITVATPVWRVAEHHLRAAVESVRRQTYSHWELILWDDGVPDRHVREALDALAGTDRRIRVVHGERNLGIARASNEIVRLARGDYVGFLDHDDLLHGRALELCARFLATHPQVDWLFTDEDKIDAAGRHGAPCFKPGWSHHLLLAFNYVAHFRVVRAATLRASGGHREGFDGAQDYDLALRVLAAGGRFAHLPGVLYHWRMLPTSMAATVASKPTALERAQRALYQHAQAWPAGDEVRVGVLLAAASFFDVRRVADPHLGVTILEPREGSTGMRPTPRRPCEVLSVTADLTDPEELVAAARAARHEVLVMPPPGGFGDDDLAELLALLQVPHTALAGARAVRGFRVAGSGFVVDEAQAPVDPWRGLHRHDGGYLNLALMPGPRTVPLPVGWAAWKHSLLAAWDRAPDVPAPWRLAVGWQRREEECVVTPRVRWRPRDLRMLAAPEPPAPPEIVPRWRSWLDAFHVTDMDVRAPHRDAG